MTTYHPLFGRDLSTDEILAMLDLTELDVERFRDCWFRDDDDEMIIIIFTRTGGGNREAYPNKKLTSHPCYIRDYDDDWDTTYAYYEFVIPEMDGGAEDEG